MVRWTCVSLVKLTVVDVAWVTPFLLRAPKVAPHKQLIDGDEKGPMPHVELTATAAAWVPGKGKPRHVACCVKMFCFFLRLGLRGGDTAIPQSTYQSIFQKWKPWLDCWKLLLGLEELQKSPPFTKTQQDSALIDLWPVIFHWPWMLISVGQG